MCHKIHPFKVYNSMVSSIFTELCSCHHYLIPECFHDSMKTSHTINNHSPFPPLSFLGGSDSIECLQFGKPRFDSWVGKILWRRAWQPTPVFLPGESHEQWSLPGYSPWVHTELETTGRLTLSLFPPSFSPWQYLLCSLPYGFAYSGHFILMELFNIQPFVSSFLNIMFSRFKVHKPVLHSFSWLKNILLHGYTIFSVYIHLDGDLFSFFDYYE